MLPVVLTSDSLSACLELSGEAQKRLHDRAAGVRNNRFGNRVFVRGVVEISNFCRENCGYCAMRRDHRKLNRFRLSADEIMEEVVPNIPEFVTDLNIQAGEDPIAVREIAIPLLKRLKQETPFGLSVCLGTLCEGDYAALRDAGAEYYIIKVETGNAEHYRSVEAPGSLEERLVAIRHLSATGWRVSSGFVLGLPGQTAEILEETMKLLGTLPLAGCSVSPFIPGENTRFPDCPASGLGEVLNMVAALRLLMPEGIIPAVSAMCLAGEGGYAGALKAGANLATVNLTPEKARPDYQIYRRQRHIMTGERVLSEIEQAGCEPSRISMRDWLALEGSVKV